MEQMMNSTNVQKQLQVKRRDMYRLIQSGQLVAYRMSPRRWRFKPSDVARCQRVIVCQ
jgi:excisionase family DNA binding protein